MALSNKDIGGFNKLWCMNFTTSFSLLIWWYKKEACSVVSLLTILVGVLLHGNIVFGIIVRGNFIWGILDGNVALECTLKTVVFLFWSKLCFRSSSPRKVDPRKDSPQELSPRKDSPCKVSPHKDSPRKVSPRQQGYHRTCLLLVPPNQQRKQR